MTEKVRRIQVLVLLSLATLLISSTAFGGITTNDASLTALSGVTFEENIGQFDNSVLGRTVVHGTTVWFTADAIIYQFGRSQGASGEMVDVSPYSSAGNLRPFAPDRSTFEYLTLAIRFEGEPLQPEARFGEKKGGAAHYLIGNDASSWITDVIRYDSFRYDEIYPGIDIEFYEKNGKLEWDLLLQPGADLKAVQLRFDHAEDVQVKADGSLSILTAWGEIKETIPEAFQIDGSERNSVDATFELRSDGAVGFASNALDPTKATVIDPVVEFSTYLGGTWYDEGWGIDTDDEGNIYVCGLTASTDFPVMQPFQASPVFPVDIFVSKLSPSGDQLLYSTYLGGNNYEGATSLALDSGGNIFLTGEVKSTDFPVVNAYQDTYADSTDAFATKIAADGKSLVFSTYLGGTAYEYGHTIVASSDGEALVIGQACSPDFPISNAFQPTYGGHVDVFPPHCGDFFIVRIDASGNVIYSTFLGGSHYDEGWGIAIDNDKNAYFCGLTASADFPTVNQIQTASVLADAIFGKLSADGQSLEFCSYFGGNDYDGATSIAIDKTGNIYFAGETKSSDFPTREAFMETHNLPGTRDAFVTKINPTGEELIYSSYLGGEFAEVIWDIAVDDAGGATVCGHTFSADFPTFNASQPGFGGRLDGFITRFAPGGNLLTFSSFAGGSEGDLARSVALSGSNSLYFVGSTTSGDFPTVNALYPDYLGGDLIFPRGDAFISRIVVAHKCGDMNGSGAIDLSDALFLLNYIFGGGESPADGSGGDVTCDGRTTITDIVYMIYYIFEGGPVPCAACL